MPKVAREKQSLFSSEVSVQVSEDIPPFQLQDSNMGAGVSLGLTAGVSRQPAPPPEINFKCKKQKTPLHLKYYLSDVERRELIASIGDAAVLLFEHYHREASRAETASSHSLSDATIAQQFGWTEQKVKRYRLALTKLQWFRVRKYSAQDGRKSMTYYIGKDAVAESYKK